jgi:hypothetical protein
MRFIVIVTVVLYSTAVAAETMKPGLWEMTMKSDQMKHQAMPDLSPAQKEQMQKMGIPVPTTRDGAIVQQVCITKEAAASAKTPGVPRDSGECKVANQSQSGNTYRADVICNGPNLKGNGTLKGSFSGNTSYTSSYEFKGTSHGREVTQQHETSSKWLGADCGKVKPMSEWNSGAPK